MREFDDFEKRMIVKLKAYKSRGVNLNFLSLLDGFLIDRGIEVRRSTKEAWIYFDARKFATYDRPTNAWVPKQEIIPEIAPTTETIIKAIFLLSYLEKNGLVFLFDFAQSTDDFQSFPPISRNTHPAVRQIVSDKRVSELLIDYFHKEIVISQSIVNLVDNNFLTKEEVQHKENIEYANRSLDAAEKSIKVSNRAIIYSIILGLIGIASSIYSILQSEKQMGEPIKIEEQQLNEIKTSLKPIDEKKELEDILRGLDSLKAELKTIHQTTKQIYTRMKTERKVSVPPTNE